MDLPRTALELFHALLNLGGLALWLKWCAARLDPLAQAKASTLAGTLKPTRPTRSARWMLLAGVVALLLLRPLAYWLIGRSLDWRPTMDFAATLLLFRSDFWTWMLLFSLLSFGRTLAVFYLGVLFLALVNRRLADTDPFQKLARVALGGVARWPWALQFFLPVILGVSAWLAAHPLLAHLGIVPRAAQSAEVFQQGLRVFVHEALWLRYLVAAVLLAHLLNSYVYLGAHPLWDFVNGTARHLLAPLRWLPLRLAKVDFAPVVMIALVFAVAELILLVLAGKPPGWIRALFPAASPAGPRR